MAKLYIKTLIISITFFTSFILLFFNLKAGSSDNLILNDGDYITTDIWNSLVNNTIINFQQAELSNPDSDIVLTSSSSYPYILPGMSISDFQVGPSGKIYISFSCSNYQGLPQYRVYLNGLSNFIILGSSQSSNPDYHNNVSGEAVFTGLEKGSKHNIQLGLISGSSSLNIEYKTKTSLNYNICRFTAMSF